jgi:hypothetical protein
MQIHDHSVLATAQPLCVSEVVSQVDSDHPIYWISRGMVVGLALGGTAGSIVPFIGTAIGAIFGVFAGFGIGVVVAMFALVTRALFPSTPCVIEIRERIACLAVIWAPVVLQGRAGHALAIPAALGSIHTLAAGTPTKLASYTGHVSAVRARICKGLPVVIISIIGAGWVVVLVVIAVQSAR